MFDYAKMSIGEEAMSHMVQSGQMYFVTRRGVSPPSAVLSEGCPRTVYFFPVCIAGVSCLGLRGSRWLLRRTVIIRSIIDHLDHHDHHPHVNHYQFHQHEYQQ